MKSIACIHRPALVASFLSLFLPGCSSLCDLRNPQTGQPIPSQFTGTSGVVKVKHQFSPSAVLQNVETVSCNGYDRMVFEFSGGVPGYEVKYVDKPIYECGSGHVVRVAGDAWLKVHFTPAQAHDIDTGTSTVADRNRVLDYANARQLVDVCDFEGNVEWVLGVRTPGRFRVTELPDPPRVVVDVKQQ